MKGYICEHCGAVLDPGERCDCQDVRVIVLKVDGTIEIQVTDGSLRAFQEIVGGYIEHVSAADFGLIVNEEGLIRGLPLNPFFPELCGNVILVKEPEDGGDEFRSFNEYEAIKLADLVARRMTA